MSDRVREPLQASSPDPMAGPVNGDDRHPLILLLSAFFWVFRKFQCFPAVGRTLKLSAYVQYGCSPGQNP